MGRGLSSALGAQYSGFRSQDSEWVAAGRGRPGSKQPPGLAYSGQATARAYRAAAGQAPGGVFHSVENFFSLCGKTPKKFSIVWKKRAYFSTVWKNLEPRFVVAGAAERRAAHGGLESPEPERIHPRGESVGV